MYRPHAAVITRRAGSYFRSPMQINRRGLRMKSAAFLSLFLLLSATALLPVGSANSKQSDNTFPSFWTKFKTAVIRGDRETVAQLSKFPIGMLSPAANVK